MRGARGASVSDPRPIVAMELFSCSGGMAEGFRRAGLEMTLVFDHDGDACASYEANLGRRPIRLDAHDLLRMTEAGWRPPALDLVVADPPCTPWSSAGQRRGLADERDCLLATARLLALWRPRAWLVGNVPGLALEPARPARDLAFEPLNAAGYCIDHATLDAADHGVPQHRVRPFWFGHLSGECLRWPVRTYWSPEKAGPTLFGEARPAWVTCREALGHLSGPDLGRPIRLRRRDRVGASRESEPDAPAKTVTTSPLGDGNVLAVRGAREAQERASRAGAPARTLTSSALITTKGASRSAVDTATLAWPWNRPATTVTADERIPPPGHHDETQLSLPGAILLSERAGAILQGFPAGWTFRGRSKVSRWSQIGQAMPPPLAEAVARSVRTQLEATPS